MVLTSLVPSLARALALVLLAAPALAQSPQAPAGRGVTVTGNPSEPVPELRAALGVPVVLFFDAEIRPKAIAVDRERVKLVGTGERFVIVQLQVALGANGRVPLEVPYADGALPKSAVFSIVERPSEVDTRLEVLRPVAAGSTCEAQLAQARAQAAALTPARLVRSGLLDGGGVKATRVSECMEATSAHGLRCTRGTLWVASTWMLFDLKLRNAEDQAPWRPRSATIRNPNSGASWSVRAVEAEPPELAPGQTGRVFVQVPAPEDPQALFTLELEGSGGRTLTIPQMSLSTPKKEPSP